MIRLLVTKEHSELISLLTDTIDEAGYPPEEAIPALVAAIHEQARGTADYSAALDEAAELLADDQLP